MAERNQAAGYMAIAKQTTPTTPVTPSILVPFYKQSLETSINLIQDKPVYGGKFEIFQQLQGMRSHKGQITVMAEPYTAMYWMDMLLTLLSTTGSGPYVRTYGLSTTTDPNFYTMDINLVSQCIRFYGVGASKLSMPFVNEEMQFDLSVSALGSYYAREIASVASQVITLTTTYDPVPTNGLVVGDKLSVKSTDGTVNVTGLVISSITNTTVTVTGTLTGVAAGQMLVLAPNTSLTLSSLLTPFLWPLTNYKFASTLSGAQAAAQTRLESGTTIDIEHKFESDDGSKRSGAFDPASLIRTTGLYAFKTKQYFDLPDQLKLWLAISKQGAQMLANSGANNSLAVNMNNIKLMKRGEATQFGQTIYQDEEYGPMYDTTDGAGMTVVVTNQSSTM